MCDATRDDESTPLRGQNGGPVRSDFRVIDSRCLFGDRREICICHAGETYRLRITRNGKLILNK